MTQFATMETRPNALLQRLIANLVLTWHQRHTLHHRFLVFALQQLVPQMHRHTLHHRFLHQHCLQGDNQVFVQHWQTHKQNHDNVFLPHGLFQICEHFHKRFNLVDKVQQTIIFCILYVENLSRMKRILDEHFGSWMLQKVFNAFAILHVFKLVVD